MEKVWKKNIGGKMVKQKACRVVLVTKLTVQQGFRAKAKVELSKAVVKG
jgi:hypothetical protein